MRVSAILIVSTIGALIAELLPTNLSPVSGAESIQQNSEGSCSPPIVNNSGQISINCHPIPLENKDFRVRFCVVSYQIEPIHYQKAPKLMHIRGRFGTGDVEFDLRLLDSIVYGSTRGAPMPEICYESEHFLMRSLSMINQQGIVGRSFSFGVPFELQNLVGPETKFSAELFIRDQWYTTGMHADSSIEIEIRSPQ
jgi:hypothetical protein